MTTQNNKAVVDTLSNLLASSYTLYLKTQNFHWNVTGPMFMTLHTLFEEQYNDLATAVDDVAERIRSVGAPAPGSYTEFAKLSDVKEETGHPDAKQMIRALTADHEKVAQIALETIKISEQAGDEASADLATARLDVHEKSAWMLRSHLE